MKSLTSLLLPLFLTIPAFALPMNGNDGGGGHFCKSQATLFIQNISDALDENKELAKKYPEWQKMSAVTDPVKNPNFAIKILKRPIQNCRNTEDALACSRPSENTMEIFCGENGWNSLPTQEKYKQIVHELYWWSDLDDSNYFYSAKLMKDVYPNIEELASLSQKFLLLGKGEIPSTEAFLNSTGKCQPRNLNGAAWIKQKDGKLICQATAGVNGPYYGYCAIQAEYGYSIIINGKYSFNGREDFTTGSMRANVGTEYVEADCKSYARQGFKETSLVWLKALEQVNRGLIIPSNLDSNRCYTKDFRFTYDPTTNQIGDTEFGETRAPCF
jgi:hypothetical protein